MNELEHELKALLIDALELEDITIEEIETDAPLFGDGLGLDSIDALEIGLELQRRYGVELDPEDEATREHFASIASLANLVRSQQKVGPSA
jgi:acyl carrier protein